MKKKIKQHIKITPDVCGGKPCIAGHRIRVQDIVIDYEYFNMSPEEILSAYPGITLADVHAALAYYYDNIGEINQSIQEEEEFYRKMKAKSPSQVMQKLDTSRSQRIQNASNDQISH